MQASDQLGPCELCGRPRHLTFHHLIPRTCHSNKWFRKRFSREEMSSRGLDLCRQCHSYIHDRFDEKELGRELNTRDTLLSHDKVFRFVQWVRKQK